MPEGQITPLFSVVVATHNRRETLPRAIRSVLQQTFSDFELLIVDDASEEPHIEALSSFEDARIRVFRNTENLGAAAARNKGIEAARGHYIAFLDDDDEYLPSFLNATRDALQGSPPEVALSWCSVQHVVDSDKGAHVTHRQFATQYGTQRALFEALLSIGTGFGVTVKAAALREVGSFNAQLRAVEDTELFYRIISRGFVPLVIPGTHVTIHEHEGPRLTDSRMSSLRIRECEWLLREYGPWLDQYPSIRHNLLRGIASLKTLAAET